MTKVYSSHMIIVYGLIFKKSVEFRILQEINDDYLNRHLKSTW